MMAMWFLVTAVIYCAAIEASLPKEIIEFLATDNSTYSTMVNMQIEFEYLGYFYCKLDRMKKRYDSKWFKAHQTTLEDVQPFYFLHIHKNGGMTVVKELEVLWKDKYWCQSERTYASVINDKSIFPYKKPLVITFIRKPLDQVLSSYRMNYDMAVAKGYSKEEMRSNKVLLGDIDSCFADQNCTNVYIDLQSRDIGGGGTFDRQKFWFVGMTEMMYTSLCLLKYKMGSYNRTMCDCSYRSDSKIPHDDHHSSHAITPSSISKHTKGVILSRSQEDIKIYDASFQFFVEELHSMESQSGINFNCGTVVNCATC